jgi:hypothetical protein
MTPREKQVAQMFIAPAVKAFAEEHGLRNTAEDRARLQRVVADALKLFMNAENGYLAPVTEANITTNHDGSLSITIPESLIVAANALEEARRLEAERGELEVVIGKARISFVRLEREAFDQERNEYCADMGGVYLRLTRLEGAWSCRAEKPTLRCGLHGYGENQSYSTAIRWALISFLRDLGTHSDRVVATLQTINDDIGTLPELVAEHAARDKDEP